MGNKKKQTNEFDNYFDDDFEVVYEDPEDLGSYLSEDSSDNSDDYDDYDGYDGDTDYYDDYDDDDDYDDYDDYDDDDYDDDDYNSNGRDSKKKKRNDKQDPDSKKSKKKKRRGLPNVGKPVANIAKTGINATKKLVGTILRAATLILIALIILTKDTTLIAYLAVGAVLVGYELLNFFWAASRTRARSRHNNRLDTGRGLLSFVIIYAGSYLTAMFSHLIPSSPSWLTGVQGGLSIYGGLKATLLPLCIAGVVSCVVRKIIVR